MYICSYTCIPTYTYMHIPTPITLYSGMRKPTPHQEMVMLTSYEQTMYCSYELSVQLSKTLAVSRYSIMVSP